MKSLRGRKRARQRDDSSPRQELSGPAGRGASTNPWQIPPSKEVIQSIFEHILRTEDGEALVRNCSHVCAAWRHIALPVLLSDTAASRPAKPPLPLAPADVTQSALTSSTRAGAVVQSRTVAGAEAEADSKPSPFQINEPLGGKNRHPQCAPNARDTPHNDNERTTRSSSRGRRRQAAAAPLSSFLSAAVLPRAVRRSGNKHNPSTDFTGESTRDEDDDDVAQGDTLLLNDSDLNDVNAGCAPSHAAQRESKPAASREAVINKDAAVCEATAATSTLQGGGQCRLEPDGGIVERIAAETTGNS